MQIQSIGHGPFYPRSQWEMALVIVMLLFGMIFNIWIFYGLAGGWWADRSKTVCEFEDQMRIIDTYINVAKQTQSADKIKR